MTNAKRLLKNQCSADLLVEKLLVISENRQVCLLDSGGAAHLGSHFLIAGISPLESFEITHENPAITLAFLDEKLEAAETFAIFTISYDFGLKLERIKPRQKEFPHHEPDVFLALFDALLVHDYDLQETFLIGNQNRFNATEKLLAAARPFKPVKTGKSFVQSNFTKPEYLEKITQIKESIRAGDTYQTNLTQQICARLPENLTPPQIFNNLRKAHPAPFASFIQRQNSTVISASPERFFKVVSEQRTTDNGQWTTDNWKSDSEKRELSSGIQKNSPFTAHRSPLISTSPIKGTRPRGKDAAEDVVLRRELLNSEKDRAENVMIVDLLRNDLGRVCDFGSVRVEKLCDLEQHPTLFHLVSTISGKLRLNTKFSEIIRAVFPCGSITGAPKIRTMQIIDKLETATRGLSMGAIGYRVPSSRFQVPNSKSEVPSYQNMQESTVSNVNPEPDHKNLEPGTWNLELDLSVAIRTMVIRDRTAVFNVGGGIVIDSDPEDEYNETLVKAKALLEAINGEF